MKTVETYMAIGLVTATLAGCAGGTSAPSPEPTATTTQSPEPAVTTTQRSAPTAGVAEEPPPVARPKVEAEFKLPNYKGKTLDVAIDELTKAGILHDAEAINGKSVLMASNWTIASQTPAAGTRVKAGQTVTFKVYKPDETAAAPPAAEETTSKGLTATVAQAACDMHAKGEFRYGYDPSWVFGKLAERIVNDKWFLKVEAEVTNAYNAKAQVNIECVVGGTDSAPVVESFISY